MTIRRMNSKPEDLVAGLSACDTDSKLKALRGVKNQIIGNKNKKLAFIKLGAVPLVVDILREHTNDSNLLVQSAAAVGSFAYGFDPGAKAVLESDAVPQLMSTLSCQDEKVVEAGTRALKIVYQSPDAPRAKLFTDEAISRLVELLSKPGCAVAEVAASVLARCCQTTQQAQLLLQHDVLEGLLPLLSHPRPSAREAAADALAVLAERSSDVCRSIAANATALEELLLMLKATSPHLRLLAGTTLTFVSCTIRTPPSPSRSTSSSGGAAAAAAAAPAAPASSVPHAGASTSASAASTPDQQRAGEIQKVVLPVLVKLLDAPELQEQLPQVLAYLIASSAEPQKCVSDVSAVRKLTSLLKRSEASTPSSLAGTLECLGTLCMDSQQNRAALSESHSIAAVARALHSPCNRVRASAARCLRALNRSVNLPLFDNETVSCLLRLLQDDDEEVQLASCQALCNMVLDVNNSCRECILRMQGIRAFVAHTTSAHSPLRHAATNALANVAYTATTEVKTMLMEALSWERLRLLLRDAEPEVATKALLLLQNLANITEKQQADLDLLLQWAPLHELMPQLEHHLQLPAAHGLKAVEKAVLTVNNLVVGCQALRESLCSGAVPELLLPLLRLQEPSDPDQAAKVRTAAVWIIINLIFIREGKVTAMVQERVAMLRGKGLEEQLRGMRSDSHTIVRERIKQALDAVDKIARAQTSDS